MTPLGMLHVGLVIILVVFSLSVMAHNFRKWKLILALIIPIALGFAYSTTFTIEWLKGYPSKYIEKTKYLFLAYTVDKSKTWIFIWTEDLRDKSGRPYSIQIPYSKEMEKDLKSAKERTEHGVPVIIGRKPKSGYISNEDRNAPFEFYNLPYAPNTLKPEREPQ